MTDEELLRKWGFEPVDCDECEVLLGYGSGDLNCTSWLCPACRKKIG